MMMIKKRSNFRILALILVLSSLVVPSETASACTPGLPDNWYTIHLTFDSATIPAGVQIVETHPIAQPYAITNTNADPFYLVRQSINDWLTYPNSGLPDNYVPVFKIEAGRVYFWSISDSDGKWKPNYGGIDNAGASQVAVEPNIYMLDGETRQVYEDNRPDNVEIPGPQRFTILAFYQGEPLEITGTLSYSLNANYNPYQYAEGVRFCKTWGAFSLLVPVILILLVAGATIAFLAVGTLVLRRLVNELKGK
jgi:hypothetical protein